MLNIKPIVYAALSAGDVRAVYACPQSFETLPIISYYEIENAVSDLTYDGREYLSRVAYQVDVWGESMAEIQSIAQTVDDALFALGFVREFSQDLPGDTMLLHHKTLRYGGYVRQDGRIFSGR